MSRQKRRGQKGNPDAKRRQTTRAGRQGIGIDRGSEDLRTLRQQIAGDERVGLDFPCDILLSHGLITEEMRDEGLRYAMLAWWLYGAPGASCAGLYERMVAEGAGSDFTPRPEGEDASDEQLKRIRSQKARFERMVAALIGKPQGAVFQRIAGTPLEMVRRVCQFGELPEFLAALISKPPRAPNPEAYRDMTRLAEGLRRLVALRAAEDRYHHKRRAGAPAAAIQKALTPSS